MITVKWTPDRSDNNVANMAYYDPEPAFKYFVNKNREAQYLKCPAFSEYLKNTFILKAPYDINISIDDKGEVRTDRYDQEFFTNNVIVLNNGKKSITIQTIPRYTFITDSKQSLKITSLPMFLEKSEFGFIGGEFDISKWIRPVSYSIEINSIPETIIIKRGQPMFMVKFTAENNDAIKLEQGIFNEELNKTVSACVNLKNFISGKNLNAIYELSERYISLMKKRLFK